MKKNVYLISISLIVPIIFYGLFSFFGEIEATFSISHIGLLVASSIILYALMLLEEKYEHGR